MTGKNYNAWEIQTLTPKEFQTLPAQDQLIYLCKLAHLAPSTHNTQPWRFLLDPAAKSIDIYLDRKFVLPASDAVGRQSVISIGCAIENLLVSAECFGFQSKIKLLNPPKNEVQPLKNSSDERYVLLATVKFSLSQTKVTSEKRSYTCDFLQNIFSRKVTRAEYDPVRKISDEVISELQKIPDGKATKIHPIKDALRKLAISEFQGQADSYVINSQKFSRELGEWLLPNNTGSFLGMPGSGFGLNDSEAKRLHNAFSGKEALQPEDGLRFSLAGKMGIEKSPILNIITIAKDDVLHWLEAGRVLERVFLTLENHGISVAIHAGMVEVGLVNKIFAATIGTTRKIAAVFRAGWPKNEADKKRPHSPRLPIEEVLL